MTSVRLLYDLQALDLEIDGHGKRLAQLQQQIGDEGPLEGLRGTVREAMEQKRLLRVQQRDAEITSCSFEEKAQAVEQKLYGGTVRNPRELTDMQEELGYVRKHWQEAEEAFLNIMIALEECQSVVTQEQERLGQAEAVWQKEQHRLREESVLLEGELDGIQGERLILFARVDSKQAQTYEQLRKTHGGRPVAKVERGMCEVCLITLSTRELQLAQTSSAPVRCSSCGRLLLSG